MIKSVEILDIQGTAVKWLPNVPAYKERSKLEFTPGLNILWGTNGSGKSTLLVLLARMFHCEQGQDEQKVTQHSINEMFDWTMSEDGIKDISKYNAVDVRHDGSPVVYFDPTIGKGQMYAGAFDDDFFSASVQSYMFKGSSGQTTTQRLNSIVGQMVDGKFKEPDVGRHFKAGKLAVIENFLKGQLERDRPTVLLDEPDRSLDIMYQVMIWNLIKRYSDKVQIIVAAHNLLACDLDANYITFGGDQYLEDCRAIKLSMNSPEVLEQELKKFQERAARHKTNLKKLVDEIEAKLKGKGKK